MDLNDSQVLNLSKNSTNNSFYQNQSFDSSLLNDSTNPLNLSNSSSFVHHQAAAAAVAAALLNQNRMPVHDLNTSLQHGIASFVAPSLPQMKPNQTRYQQLLSVIDEMGKDIRTTYMSNKNSTERLKRSIASARILVKDCLLECERNTKSS
jgi:hypothetical protein